MGLDAYVNCRCWQDGLITAPPPGPAGLDEDGFFGLLLPYEGNEDAHHEFWSWQTRACPHPQMEVATERVANWAGVRLFQQTMAAAGGEHFPTLRAELPNANGGSTGPAAAALILAELDYFEHEARLPDEVVLLDEATGELLMRYIAAYDGVMMLGPDFRAGVDPGGFFVNAPSDPPVTLFRATRFTQRILDDKRVELTGAGRSTVLPIMPLGSPAEHLVVQTRPQSASEWDHLLGALRRLCAASIETGNPLMWT
ncbi:hypothetical protein [Actinoplanes sp. L3-i22]|uniref:hypothetical protein n=1 Tax=Actinoplanes sp. L3-i22 TaxID=2836373 RepID=UPI001C756796|nr:hypothetical protein [Actinoplanes sp. L3-i22]BCY08621.1 hypothetical protein L3i22_037090 [Actinoplanes sp. L3-i22]